MKFILPVFVLFILITPGFVEAAIVPCTGGNQCNICDLITLINKFVTFVMGLMTLIAVILFLYTGYKLVTAQGDPTAVGKARKIFVSTTIGFMLVLSSWLIVDTFMKSLIQYDGVAGNTRFGPWNQISKSVCDEMKQDKLKDE